MLPRAEAWHHTRSTAPQNVKHAASRVGYHGAMITKESIQGKREAILEVARRYGAHDVRIFGSVARGDATADSDLDIVVRFDPDRSLLDHGGLLMDLRELLGVKVDVVSEGALQGRFGELVRKEAVPL